MTACWRRTGFFAHVVAFFKNHYFTFGMPVPGQRFLFIFIVFAMVTSLIEVRVLASFCRSTPTHACMHARTHRSADYDVLWLQRDFHLTVVNLFDTGQVCERVCVCVCVLSLIHI